MRTVYVETFITFYVCLCVSAHEEGHMMMMFYRLFSEMCVFTYMRASIKMRRKLSCVSFSSNGCVQNARARKSINIDLSPTSLRSCPRPRRRRRPR
jgi:hypothetical protein